MIAGKQRELRKYVYFYTTNNIIQLKMSKRNKIIAGLILTLGFLFLYPLQGAEPIKYIERTTGEVKIEKVMGEFWLSWLYNNPLGKLSLHTLAKRKMVSDWYGKKMDNPKSVEKIPDFVEEYNIDLSITQKQEFDSFNDFFYRELKPKARPINNDTSVLISPADGKIFVYENIDKQDFIVKGYRFDLKEYLQNDKLAQKYAGGSLLIIRLCPTDYHRYHFPLTGTVGEQINIDGDYYSVNPIAIKNKVELFCMNKRTFTELQTPYFGDVIYSEVGATMVGSIIQTYNGSQVEKGDEKGYFKFGGSTVILIFEKGKLKIDNDLIENTNRGLETEVKMGEKISVLNIIDL